MPFVFAKVSCLDMALHESMTDEHLAAQWQGRSRFVILDAGLGSVGRFLAAWAAWRADSKACEQLHFIAIEPQAPEWPEIKRAFAGSPSEALVDELAHVWPPMTTNFHRLGFEGGRLQLLMAVGDVSAVLPELVCTVDAFRIRSAGAPREGSTSMHAHPGPYPDHKRRNLGRVLKALARVAAPGARLLADGDSPELLAAIAAAGFEVLPSASPMTLAHFAPGFIPRRAPSRSPFPANVERHALVIGAGLAGCSIAWALAEQGWRTTVLERNGAPAQETSGNPAGLFHGIVNPQDGAHARFNRAAALEAQKLVSLAVSEWGVAGATDGLLRLDDTPGGVEAMRAVLRSLGLPAAYVRAVDTAEADDLAGIPLGRPAWFYPGGGWVSPAQLAAALLRAGGKKTSLHCHTDVRSLQRVDNQWAAFDANGRCLAQAAVVVFANAESASRLLGPSPWPIAPVRGQISIAPSASLGGLPRIPIAGAGYLLPEINGCAFFGATAQPGECGMDLRIADHAYNLQQLQRLTGRVIDLPPVELKGRVGIRWSTDDRLPIVGAVPDIEAAKTASRLDQPRFVPRLPGVFVFTALGSRGITWCPLSAHVLASAIAGAPAPLEASLLDAIDAGRFVSRQARRATRR